MEQRSSKRLMAANIFGTLGYASAIFQWVWSLLLLSYPLITENPSFFLPANNQSHAPQPVELDPALTPLITVVAVIATVFILALTIVAIIRLPKSIGSHASTLSKSTAKAVIPAITRKRKISKKERQRLSYKIILVLKLCIIVVPLLLLVFIKKVTELPVEAVWIIGVFSAACSIVYFTLQYAIARIGKLSGSKLW